MHTQQPNDRPHERQPAEHSRPEAARLRAVELLLIAVVWAFYGVLNVATQVLEPGRDRPVPEALAGVNPRIFINPVVWAVLTTLILWMSRRISLDRAFWRRRSALVVLAALVVANVSDLVSDAFWDRLAPASAVRRAERRGEGPRLRPGLGNLTWLDDFGVILAALAAASARGWVLRERARREQARRRESLLEAESARVRADAAQLHAQLAEAKLDALRRQLDPHFLFNTLNAVSALMERDPRGVRRMIGQLSDLLRHSMDGSSAPEIPLRQELDLLGRYVDIMRVRFADQLEVETRIDPQALDGLVPNMILQPLVENAIKHGVEQRADGGRVEIEAQLDGRMLVLRVRDNGPVPAQSMRLPAADTPINVASVGRVGVGIQNTAARLAQLYGAEHRFVLGPDPEGGTLVEIRLPYRKRDGAVADATTSIELSGANEHAGSPKDMVVRAD
jgi:two-component system, LytTR family, sensor kinase